MVYSVGEIAENPPAQEVLLPVWNICAGIRPCILELIFLPAHIFQTGNKTSWAGVC